MKIIADDNMPLVQELFSPYGEITMLPGRDITADDVQQADVLLVRSVTQVNESLLGGSKVRFVGSSTIGADHIDQSYLQHKGVKFANAPGCNANAVVQYVLSVLSTLRSNWMKQTIGIIGCGAIGGKLYKILRALGVECRCYDPFLAAASNPHLVTFEAVLESDILSLHVPLTDSGFYPTYHLFNEQVLRNLAPNVLLINTSRGAVLDNQSALRCFSEKSWQLVLDVWEGEPDISLGLLKLVDICSPHIAGYSYDGKIKGTQMIFDAFCSSYGFDTPIPIVRDEIFELTSSSLAEAVLETFDVKKIDHLMRESLLKKEACHPQEFDRLRKNFPQRFEFQHYCLAKNSDELLAKSLSILGFKSA
jgi:erythronate-4-phosphate dehydrogenase